MPKRPPQHLLEEESRRAFEDLVSPWIVRTLAPDYGLDCEVELVEKDGTVTGATFKVQIKATDEPALDVALKVRMAVDRVIYALEHDVPTLLARYHSPTQTFYADWFHSVAPDLSSGNTSVTIALSPSSALTDARLRSIAQTLGSHRALRRASASNRVPLRLYLPSGDAFGFSKARIQLAVRTCLERVPTAFFLAESEDDAIVVLKLQDDAVHVFVGGEHSGVLTDQSYANDELEKLAADVVIMAATAVAHRGHAGLSVPLISGAFLLSSLPDLPEGILDVAGIYAHANRGLDLLTLTEASQRDLGVRGWHVVKFLVPTLINAPLDEQHLDRVEELLRRHADEALELHGAVEAATATFNVATFLRVRRESGPEAVALLQEARNLNPKHDDRDYFHADLGGSHFNADEFEQSAASYAKALELGVPEDDFRALLADARLMSGSYAEALEDFQRYGSGSEVMSPTWSLKYAGALWLVESLGITHQNRDEEGAHEILDTLEEGASPDDAIDTSRAALSKDALCARALGCWGAGKWERGDPPQEFAIALMLAADFMGDIHEAWVEACFALAVSGPDWNVFTTAAIQVAYERCSERFAAALHQKISEMGIPAVADRLIEVIDDVVKAYGISRRRFGIRIVNPDTNSYEVVSQ